MALKTRVKVGNITNLSDARYCAGMGVDLLGFPLDTHSGSAVSLDQVKEFVGWVSGPEFVLEIKDLTQLEALKEYSPQFLFQLPAPLLLSTSVSARLIVEVSANEWTSVKSKLVPHSNVIQQVLLSGGNQAWTETIKVVKEIAGQFPVLFHYEAGLSLDEVLALPVSGIALSGSQESKPGLKEYGRLAEVLEALEVD